MRDLLLPCILIALCVIGYQSQETNRLLAKNNLDWHMRSSRYGQILSAVTLECSLSKGPTISCTDDMLKCMDRLNSAVGEFDFEISYRMCRRISKYLKR